MNLEELFLKRQSCRNYRTDPVPHALLEKLIESARLAPSACNSQPWFYHVAESPEKVRAIAAASQELGMNGFVKNVPAFIVVAEDKPNLTERIGMRLKDQDFASLDLGLSVSADSAGGGGGAFHLYDRDVQREGRKGSCRRGRARAAGGGRRLRRGRGSRPPEKEKGGGEDRALSVKGRRSPPSGSLIRKGGGI